MITYSQEFTVSKRAIIGRSEPYFVWRSTKHDSFSSLGKGIEDSVILNIAQVSYKFPLVIYKRTTLSLIDIFRFTFNLAEHGLYL